MARVLIVALLVIVLALQMFIVEVDAQNCGMPMGTCMREGLPACIRRCRGCG
ncbi:unnamed protein product, partial [Rotaria sp. Silwood2]